MHTNLMASNAQVPSAEQGRRMWELPPSKQNQFQGDAYGAAEQDQIDWTHDGAENQGVAKAEEEGLKALDAPGGGVTKHLAVLKREKAGAPRTGARPPGRRWWWWRRGYLGQAELPALGPGLA